MDGAKLESVAQLIATLSRKADADASDSDASGSGASSASDASGSDASDDDGADASGSDADEEAQHQAQLRELEKADPAFFAYLRENEPALLDFGEADDNDEQPRADGDSDAEADLSSSDEEPSDDEEAAADAEVAGVAAEDEDEVGDAAADVEATDGDQVVTAERVARWNAALDARTVGERTARLMSGRWPKLRALAKAYAMTYLGLLSAVNDAPTSRVLLRHAPRLAPYAAVEAPIGHRLNRLVVDAWASSGVSAATRLRAYLTLRAIILARPASFFTPLLKLCVAAYRRRVGARNSPRALPRIAFAVRSLVELTALDVAQAYTLAFGGIRDLAITLRGALTAADKVAGRLPVLSWPFLNSLRLWAAVLCAAPSADAGLGALVYPFVQVCLGAMGLAVTPRTFPVRFHIAGWLADVQAASGAYVPLAPPLLEVLQYAGVRTAGFRSGLVRRSLLLLGRHAAGQASHVAFPELVAPTVGALKRFASTTRVPEFRADVAGLVDALTATASAVAAARSTVPFGPRDAATVCGKPGTAGMQRAVLDSLTAGGRTTPVEGWYRVERERLVKEDALRDAGMDGSDAEEEVRGAGGGDAAVGADSTDDDGDDDDDDDNDDDSDGGGGQHAGEAVAREARAAKKATAKERKAAKTAAARSAATRAMQRPVRLSAPGVDEDTVDTLVLSDSDSGDE
ncbi:hypothetical protein I4F81_010533 [Pyropia yezoensis]|uniref:Uncharacterized protein n=1 Tax=Pyropia yezoensis TaxID=2788 RepID=A0ACC3CCP2_PYRYE|nr:hypothetical protein I4F81_010533 [Neopyropia yezoensis]